MILHLVTVACILTTCKSHGTSLDSQWQLFKTSYTKTYSSQHVEQKRRHIWEENNDYVITHNKDADRGLHSYRLGMNVYGDKTTEEFLSEMSLVNLEEAYYVFPCPEFKPSRKLQELPSYVNWTAEGYVTNVKHQGECGSCWAHAAVGALEAQVYKQTGNLASLSTQNLVDCVKSNYACSGGWVQNAYEYIINNDGIDTEQSYPYTAKAGTCEYKNSTKGATVRGCMRIKKGSEEDLQQAIATVGPVSVGIDASKKSFQFYRSGVYDEPKCASFGHYVLAVGYGTEDSKEYWLAKNSWGTTWGERGYVRMSRNKDNQCKIASYATFPVL